MASRSSSIWVRAKSCMATISSKVTNRGGHSSEPVPDNAIYHLADGLARLAGVSVSLRAERCDASLLRAMAKVQTGKNAADMNAIVKTPPDQAAIARLSADPLFNATMRTTCVATRLDAGHANNALPERATANVNCRILPGHSVGGSSRRPDPVLADPKMWCALLATTAPYRIRLRKVEVCHRCRCVPM